MTAHTDGDDPRLADLLLRWEELHDQGRSLSAEELCSTCPELAEELGRRIALLRRIDPLVDGTATADGDHPGPEPAAPRRASATARADFHDLRFHAAGALGEVFMARNAELNREVALKFLRSERTRDPDSRRRFLQEAEVTGRLEHPGVVPIYALGTDATGSPCYAMRFIRGETLQDAIDAFHSADEAGRDPSERSLSMRELLDRFASICNTMGYAHSRGILHRDLKPRNVMLGKYDETLVVDWGLAKPFERDDAARSVGEETLMPSSGSASDTPTLGIVGTPAYMSPEQAEPRWDAVGPASDLFGLGGILYAILTGQPPYQGRKVGEILEKVRRCEFPAPRQVEPGVPRPLEAICLKAMARRPEDRYATAPDLAADVRRWMADEVVAAYPEGLSSRTARWARRHRTGVQAGVAALLVVAVVSAAAWLLTDRARRGERSARSESQANLEEARANFRMARQAVDDSLTLVSEETLFDEPGLQPLRRKLLRAALEYHERFLRDHGGDRDLRREAARSQLRLAAITEALGRGEEALALYLACRPRYGDLLRDEPRDIASRRGMVECLINSAGIQTDLSKRDQAEEGLGLALRLLDHADDIELRASLARATWTQGRLAASRGRFTEAQRLGERAVTLQEGLVREHPERARFRVDLSYYYLSVGQTMIAPRRRAEALRMCGRACAIEEEFLRADPGSLLHQFNLGRARYGVGQLRMLAEDWAGSASAFEAARLELEPLVRRNPTVRTYSLHLGRTLYKLGTVQERAGGSRDAVIGTLRQAVGLFQGLHRQEPQDVQPLQGLVGCTDRLGEILAGAGRIDEAIEWFGKCVAFEGELLERDRSNVFTLAGLCAGHGNLGQALARAGRYEEAVSSLREALEIVRRAADGGAGFGHFGEQVPNFFLLLAESLHELGRPAEVEGALSEYERLSLAAPRGLYDLACRRSRGIIGGGEGRGSMAPDAPAEGRGDPEAAMFWLRRAVRAGWRDARLTGRDPDLAALRDREDFRRLLGEMLDRGFPADPFAR